MFPSSVVVRRAPIMVMGVLLSTALVSTAAGKAETLPACPPPFESAAVYVAGEIREGNGRIYQCNPDYGGAYLRYCNIPHWDDSLMVEDERMLWERAWVQVGPCRSSGLTEVAEEGDVDDGAGPAKDDENAEAWPPCPPPFQSAAVYVAGEIREGNGRIYRCNPDYGGAYLRYCNIPHWDDSLMVEDERMLWERAWVDVGPCRSRLTEVAEDEDGPAKDDDCDGGGGDGVGPADDATTDTCSADDAACNAQHFGDDASNAEAWSPCPPPFEHEVTYVVGELREHQGDVYQCNVEQGGAYERYCNVRDWDDSLLEEDERAKELWDRAWVLRGACKPSASEEEVAEENVVDRS